MDNTNLSEQIPINIIKTFDISNIQNDFIYKLIDYYLDEISVEPSDDIIKSITNLVDTIMSFYLLAQSNGVINIANSRKLLEFKLNKNNFIEQPNNNLLDQCQQLNEDFDTLEKYLIEKTNNFDEKHKTNTNNEFVPDNDNTKIIDETITEKNINTVIRRYPKICNNHKQIKCIDEIDKLDGALSNLYTRIDTPVVKLAAAIIFYKIIMFIFGL